MRKLSLLFVGVLVSLFLLLPSNVKAITNIGKEDSTRFTAVNGPMYNSFAGSNHFGISEGYHYVKYLKDGNKVWPIYCGDFTTVFVEDSNYSEGVASDIGIQYIISQGFKVDQNTSESYYYSTHNGCSLTNCDDVVNLKTNSPKNNQPWYVNYWLTQVAIWVYEEKGRENEEEVTALKNRLYSANDLTDDEKLVKRLVDEAKEVKESATNFNNVDPKLTVSDTNMTLDGDYYYSKEITATGTGEKFTISTNNNKFKVVNSSKTEKTEFNKNEKFYIRVAKSDITSSQEVTVTITTKGNVYSKQFVKQGNQLIQSYKLEETNPATSTLKLNLSYTKNCDVTVKIIDSETKEQICGGSVIIQDKDGKEVATMTFTEDNCTQTVSLPDGNYKAVQKEAPDSYIKDDKTYEIDTKTKCPVEIEIPNTRLYKIRILKTIQGTENPVEGAKLKLEDSNGKTILEFVSSTEPTVINSLYAGTYYLSEVEAPSGYALKTDKMEIQVNATTNDKLFMFPNDEIVVPITDFNSNLLWISLALCLLGAGLIFYSKKRLKSVA